MLEFALHPVDAANSSLIAGITYMVSTPENELSTRHPGLLSKLRVLNNARAY
jgi:hypothetical protein